MSRVFINRPVATSLLTFAIALAGFLAFIDLPVSALPQIELPSIMVQAAMPGASAETMAATVATPLERALGKIAGVSQIASTSLLGASKISLQFELERDIYAASRDVQAAINAVSSLLPSGMPSRPNFQRVNPADAPIMILALTASGLRPDHGQMQTIAESIIAKKLMQITGMGQVQVSGGNRPAVRIELNPHALAKYNIDLESIRSEVKQTNLNRPKGILESARERWQIQANDQAKSTEDYASLIIRYRHNAPVTLADLGFVIDSVEDFRNIGLTDGQSSVVLILKKEASANAIAVVDVVNDLLPELRATLPKDMALSVVLDQSIVIRASIHELELSLILAVVLVFLITWVFLQDISATFVPMVSVVVVLLAACVNLYFCQFSLNNLTLMALIVATGFIVDDALVVVENTKRHIASGVNAYQAACLTSKETGFTLLAMSLSCIAVFLPVLFMSGISGRVFREFAITLSVAVLFSLLISLSTTPMLCARWLGASIQPSRILSVSVHLFNRVLRRYAVLLQWAINHGRFILCLFLSVLFLALYLYHDVKKGFFPVQDEGRLNGLVLADQSTSPDAMKLKLKQFSEVLQQDPAVSHVVGYAGGGITSNAGSLFVVLKPNFEREAIDVVMTRLRTSVARVSGANLLLFVIQDLRLGGASGVGQYHFALQSDNVHLLWQWAPKILAALRNRSELSDVNSDLQDKSQQISLVIDREKASRYGINQAMIEAGLYNAFGQRQISQIYNTLNQYPIVMELAPEYRQSQEALKQVFITVPIVSDKNTSSVTFKQVPLSSFAHFTQSNTPLTVSHQGQFASIAFSFALQKGFSLDQAADLIKDTLQEIGAPEAINASFLDSVKAVNDLFNMQSWLFLATILAVYCVLGILYESFIHPLTILSVLPTTLVGALLALKLSDSELNVTSIIGILLLIGIVKKNAIIMVDFAIHAQRHQGLDSRSAIYQACLQRFRPIMMTTLVALFTALPLLLAKGYGAELRQPLGIVIVGGLIFSQLLSLFTTPVVYIYLDHFHKKI